MGKTLKTFAEWRLEENMREYEFYFRKYEKLLTSMFKWNNLPCGISARFIEDKLFHNGFLIFFESKKLKFHMVTMATPIGYNAYNEPIGYRAYATNGFDEYVSAEECVRIDNNIFMEGNVGNVRFFAKRLSNIEKTADINLEQMKVPFIVACGEGQKTSVEQVFKQKTDGVPYIFVNEDFANMNNVSVLTTGVTNHTKELQDLKLSIENQALTFFGINNVDIVKRERLVSGEADGNNEQININKASMFNARLKACEEINDKFGFDISVELSDIGKREWGSNFQEIEGNPESGGGE